MANPCPRSSSCGLQYNDIEIASIFPSISCYEIETGLQDFQQLLQVDICIIVSFNASYNIRFVYLGEVIFTIINSANNTHIHRYPAQKHVALCNHKSQGSSNG